ncbi:MAG: tRNA epoxyqueuosine(34) reductase QueG [Polyangiaceae bacterium]
MPGSADELPDGAAWHHPAQHGALAESARLGEAIREAALRIGFARVGFCTVEPLSIDAGRLRGWLDRGMNGEMAYLAGERGDPAALLGAARSVIVVALAYARGDDVPLRAASEGRPLTGYVARYARGADYHGVIKQKLRALADECATLAGRPVLARPCVDSAPLLERAAAQRAGLGFVAKSTMTIVPGLGSYFLLGELLLDVDLEPGRPVPAQCGRCTACLTACPTNAFVDAHTLDARRCISYLTIELRGAIPRELRAPIGRMVFGCDICQDVCPFNHSRHERPSAPELAPRAELTEPDLIGLLELTASGYRRLVQGSALRRVSRERLQRNAAVALGNSGARAALEPLLGALRSNRSALVRLHCAWAIGRLGFVSARSALVAALAQEADTEVLGELRHSIESLDITATNASP